MKMKEVNGRVRGKGERDRGEGSMKEIAEKESGSEWKCDEREKG